MPLSCRVVLALATALALGASASVFADGNAARGETLSYTCLGCHGIEDYRNAYPNYTVPRLAGQHADYIVAALKEYRDGTRMHPTMHIQASTLSDQDMQDIAAYFASEVNIKTGGPTVGTEPAKVTQLCVSCHGKDGVGISDAYPTLKGQHADYLEQAITEYQDGERKHPVMSTFARGLTVAEIRTIADYYSEQAPGLKTLERRLTILSAK
jgi:cytochrome c553